MSLWLKQSTARTVPMGPFVDSTDFSTVETALSLTQAETRLSKNGGAFAQKNDATTASHLEEGTYGVVLDATDTNTLGHLRIQIQVAGALIVWQDFVVVPANVWDSLFGADKLQVHADEITAGLITAAAIADGAIDAATFAAGAIDATAIAADAIGSAEFAQAAADKVWATAARALTDKAGFSLSAGGVQAIWDALTAALTTANTIGKLLVDNINATISSRLSTADATTEFDAVDAALVAIDNFVDTEVDAIYTRIGAPAGASIAADLADIEGKVDDLETRLTAALADKLTKHAAAVLALVMAAGSTTTELVFSTVEGAAPSAVDDFYNGRVVIFTSGALAGQAVEITDYVGATTTATISAATGAAANAVTAVIV